MAKHLEEETEKARLAEARHLEEQAAEERKRIEAEKRQIEIDYETTRAVEQKRLEAATAEAKALEAKEKAEKARLQAQSVVERIQEKEEAIKIADAVARGDMWQEFVDNATRAFKVSGVDLAYFDPGVFKFEVKDMGREKNETKEIVLDFGNEKPVLRTDGYSRRAADITVSASSVETFVKEAGRGGIDLSD